MARPKKDNPDANHHEDAEGNGAVYTYIGAGADSPRVINFMGMQEFVRGKATLVTNPTVLKKIAGCPTFVEGESSEEEIFEIDESASALAKKKQDEDKRIDAKYKKKHHGE